jgi:hypothetical protein
MARKKQKQEEPIMETINGQSEDDLEKVRRLEKMLNIASVNPFGTNDPKIFDQNLKEYSISDLQNLCMKVGVYPTHSKEEMRKKLKKEFLRVTLGGRSVSMQGSTGIANPDHPNHEKVKRLMSEGF